MKALEPVVERIILGSRWILVVFLIGLAVALAAYGASFFVKLAKVIVNVLIYDEAEGCPEDGIAPGTRWADIPASWTCPECGAGKQDFEMVEI